jgi:hypothetical protein
MVEIESFDGQADGYELTPYVRVMDGDELSLEIARMDNRDEPALTYQWPAESDGQQAYKDGMAAITELGLGPVTGIELDDGEEAYDLPVEDDIDHRYESLRDLAGLEDDTAVAVRITADDATYENDRQDGFENLEAPYDDAAVEYALEQAGIDISVDEIQDPLDEDVL